MRNRGACALMVAVLACAATGILRPVHPAQAQDQGASGAAGGVSKRQKAEAALNEALARAQSAFEESDEMVAEKKALATAQGELDQRRDAVLAKLMTQERYKFLADKIAAAETRVADLQARHATPKAIAAASEEAFRLAALTGKMEREAQAADAGYVAAKERVVQANRVITDSRKLFQARLRTSIELRPLREAVEKAAAR
jgi:hypothetical protein